MSDQQFKSYAKFYDLLYQDKNYKGEAEYIDALLNKHSGKNRQELRLLDLACGTGKHLFELQTLGYNHLSGSDIAEAMISIARENAKLKNNHIEFYNYSFQDAHKVPGKFDAVISMFSAVNYITTLEDQQRTFQNIYNLLDEGGLFIFDYWNGNAVVRDFSPVKVLRKKNDKAEIIRISRTDINLIKQEATVNFDCLYLEEKNRVDEFREVHRLHYYYFSELYNLLNVAGFDIIHQSPFLSPEKEIEPYDWNISIVARKRIG